MDGECDGGAGHSLLAAGDRVSSPVTGAVCGAGSAHSLTWAILCIEVVCERICAALSCFACDPRCAVDRGVTPSASLGDVRDCGQSCDLLSGAVYSAFYPIHIRTLSPHHERA